MINTFMISTAQSLFREIANTYDQQFWLTLKISFQGDTEHWGATGSSGARCKSDRGWRNWMWIYQGSSQVVNDEDYEDYEDEDDEDEDDEDDEDEDDECSVRVTKNEDTGWEILKDGAQVVER